MTTTFVVPVEPSSKKPVLSFGGWPVDPDHPGVFDEPNGDWDGWAIIGNETRDLLVIDVDAYKMETTEHIDGDWLGLLDRTRVVTTQSGGIHVYLRTDAEDTPETIQHVDLKGDVGHGYAIAPPTPGYEIVDGNDIQFVPDDDLVKLPIFTSRTPRETPDTATSRPARPCHRHEWVRQRLAPIHIYDVIPESEYPEADNTSHPFHESDTGKNFRVDAGAATFRCWRHDVTGNGMHLAGMQAGLLSCGDWTYEEPPWAKIIEYAKQQGYYDPLTCDEVKSHDLCPRNCWYARP